MTIDTLRKRESALLDSWAVLIPDGFIRDGDRQTLLGQYSGILTRERPAQGRVKGVSFGGDLRVSARQGTGASGGIGILRAGGRRGTR